VCKIAQKNDSIVNFLSIFMDGREKYHGGWPALWVELREGGPGGRCAKLTDTVRELAVNTINSEESVIFP
jgi:hypothetical protein